MKEFLWLVIREHTVKASNKDEAMRKTSYGGGTIVKVDRGMEVIKEKNKN
jgi:hypothetical protein